MTTEKNLISIIVPVYNVKEFLPRCVETVCGQTYRNLELLLIDDGSTDGTGEMCDALAQSDSRIRVFHKPNGGSSSARNLGIKEALIWALWTAMIILSRKCMNACCRG